VLKHLALVFEIHIVRVGRFLIFYVCSRVGGPYHNEPIRLSVRKRPSKTAFTTLKIAVLAPTPKARVSTATAVSPGLLKSADTVTEILN
jgi:hypothetical protein